MNIMNDKNLSRLYDRLDRVLGDIDDALWEYAMEASKIGDEELSDAYCELRRNTTENVNIMALFKGLNYIRNPSIDGIGEPTDY